MAPVPSSINWQGSFEVLTCKLWCSALPTQPVDSAQLTFPAQAPWAHIQVILIQGLCELTHQGQLQGTSPQNNHSWCTQIRHSTLPRKHLKLRTSICKMLSHPLLLHMRQDTITHSVVQTFCNYQRFLIWTLKLTLKGASPSSMWNPLHTAGNANDKNQK